MITSIENKNFYDYLPELISAARIKSGRHFKVTDGQPPAYIPLNEIENTIKKFEFGLNSTTIKLNLRFSDTRKIILISGAGIAGLAASFELNAKGFKVIIAEKRKTFNRFNTINLDVETQRFLKKFDLLNDFEKNVAGRINTHRIVLIEESDIKDLVLSDVRNLQPSHMPLEIEFFNALFTRDGIYSVRIKDLQTFLAQKALESGVHILGNVEIEVLAKSQDGKISKVQLSDQTLTPHLFFLAEGAHSTTALQLGMDKVEIKNECTNENWIFGSCKYMSSETFVLSMINTSKKHLYNNIANLIFNAHTGEINIAVTSKKHLVQPLIQEQLLETIKQAFLVLQKNNMPQSLVEAVKSPVNIKNEQRSNYSKGNVFCIGDAAGHSSPLAGMGGTLGLTLIPRVVEQLVTDSEQQPHKMHKNFQNFTQAYTTRWIEKSQSVKKRCLGFFKSEHTEEQTVSNANKPTL